MLKAVVLAGGKEIQLKPVFQNLPKAMIPFLGRPILEHIFLLLRKHGVTQICVTLHHLPQSIMEHFQDGSRLGLSLTYLAEEPSLGTAGGVGACRDWLGNEDCIVIRGDIISDFNLSHAIEFHRTQHAEATVLLTAISPPTEHGLVLTAEDGRITRFLEKPSWGQAATQLSNTGIYLFSPSVFRRIPPGQRFDFVKDLFPRMLEREAALYGFPIQGYWNDLSDWSSYLQCSTDALTGTANLDLHLPQQSPGIWCSQPVPTDATVIPPCWLGETPNLGTGSLVGPYTILENGSEVGARALIQRSILLSGAKAGARSTLYGVILCTNATAKQDTVLNEGVVLGEDAVAEEGAVLMDGVHLWNGRVAPAGSRLFCSLTNRSQSGLLTFSDGGIIRGRLGEDIGPEGLVSIGSVLGSMGKLALGHWGGMGARMLAQAAASGATAAGCTVFTHDLECAAQSSWLAQSHQLPISLFIQQEGERIFLHFFGRDGLPLGSVREQKLEQALKQGDFPRMGARRMGETERLSITPAAYCIDAARRARLGKGLLRTLTAAVPGDSPENRGLRRCLELLGCTVTDNWHRGIPAFGAEHGGACLTAQDERGSLLEPEQLLPVLCLIEMEHGLGQVAVPDGASAACDLVTAGFGTQCLRLGRDGIKARTLYASQPWLRDAAFGAVRILSRMSLTGESLESLMAKTPRFSSRKREVHLNGDRARVMAELAQEHNLSIQGEGLRIRTGNGWVYLAPLTRRPSLRVVAESPDMELAAELCDLYVSRAMRADRKITK